MNTDLTEKLLEILVNDRCPDDVVMSILDKYNVGEITADQTIKALVLVANKRLSMIQFIGDQCFNYVEDEDAPSGRDLI